MEFVIDGARLGRILGRFLDRDDVTDGGIVPVLVTDEWMDEQKLSRLLGAPGSPELDGRTALYTCMLCSELGCGVVTALVDVVDYEVLWRDFGYQNDYEPFEPDDIFSGVAPSHLPHIHWPGVGDRRLGLCHG